MTLRPLHGLTLASLVLASCASATRGSPRWTNGQIETLPDGTRVVCRMELPTGSHIAEPVCRKLGGDDGARALVQAELLRGRGSPKPRGD